MQFAYQKGIGCQNAIHELINNVVINLNDHKKALAAFLDIQKAFDSIPHEPLFHKLNHYGITGKALNFLTSMLKTRSFTHIINKNYSDFLPMEKGIPQSSVLSGTPFILFLRHISN